MNNKRFREKKSSYLVKLELPDEIGQLGPFFLRIADGLLTELVELLCPVQLGDEFQHAHFLLPVIVLEIFQFLDLLLDKGNLGGGQKMQHIVILQHPLNEQQRP